VFRGVAMRGVALDCVALHCIARSSELPMEGWKEAGAVSSTPPLILLLVKIVSAASDSTGEAANFGHALCMIGLDQWLCPIWDFIDVSDSQPKTHERPAPTNWWR
jgi:hypothetical protein